MNSESISDSRKENLQEIISNQHDLAIYYAMKEEMCRLFTLRDASLAQAGREAWFATKESGIPALQKFAELKEKRIHGIVAHAVHHINTGKLEGFNNKIKVAKRIAYGYRNESYFFSLIRYRSLPTVRTLSYKFS